MSPRQAPLAPPLVSELRGEDEADVVRGGTAERIVEDQRLPRTQVNRDAAAVHALSQGKAPCASSRVRFVARSASADRVHPLLRAPILMP